MKDNLAFGSVIATVLLGGIAAFAFYVTDPSARETLGRLNASGFAPIVTKEVRYLEPIIVIGHRNSKEERAQTLAKPATTPEPADVTIQQARRDPT